MEKDFGVNEWLEQIRDMLRNCVLKDRSATFLISDS